ncbi:MAG: hypothetical protein ACI93G_001360 [Hyphomonas sp.]
MTRPACIRAAILSATAFALFIGASASAQDCACPQLTAERQLADADYVIRARSMGTGLVCNGEILHEGDGMWMTRFNVVKTLKGPERTETFIHHDEAPEVCGVRFTSGEDVLIFAKNDARGYPRANACSIRPSKDAPTE